MDRGVNYESRWRFLGLPLVAFACGGLDAGSHRSRTARAWIAGGDLAISPLLAFCGVAIAPIRAAEANTVAAKAWFGSQWFIEPVGFFFQHIFWVILLSAVIPLGLVVWRAWKRRRLASECVAEPLHRCGWTRPLSTSARTGVRVAGVEGGCIPRFSGNSRRPKPTISRLSG